MKKSLFALYVILTPLMLNGQEVPENTLSGMDGICEDYDEPPLFQGGPPEKSFKLWICQHYNACPSNHGNGVPGHTMVSFVITEEGDLTDVKIVRPLDPLLDAEAVRTVSTSPKWTPAKRNGKTVKVRLNFPVRPTSMNCDNSYCHAKDFFEKYIRENIELPETTTPLMLRFEFTVDESGSVQNIVLDQYMEQRIKPELSRVISSISGLKEHGIKIRPVEASYQFRMLFYPDEYFQNEMFINYTDLPLFDGKVAEEGFWDWLRENLDLPRIVTEEYVYGRVLVGFSVNETGDVTDVSVFRGVSPELDAEAVRVISSSPKWTPGREYGLPVKTQFVFPVIFSPPQNFTIEQARAWFYTFSDSVILLHQHIAGVPVINKLLWDQATISRNGYNNIIEVPIESNHEFYYVFSEVDSFDCGSFVPNALHRLVLVQNNNTRQIKTNIMTIVGSEEYMKGELPAVRMKNICSIDLDKDFDGHVYCSSTNGRFINGNIWEQGKCTGRIKPIKKGKNTPSEKYCMQCGKVCVQAVKSNSDNGV